MNVVENDNPAGTSRPIAIIGAGGHAKVIVAVLLGRDQRPCDIFVSKEFKTAHKLWGQSVAHLPSPEWWKDQTAAPYAHIGVGNNRARKMLSETVPAAGWATIIHPTAVVDKSAKIGHGVFISANAVIQPDAVIGDHTIINTGAIVEHDSRVASFCHIAPGVTLCGTTKVGEGTLVGVGCVVVPGIEIGSWAAVGAGSTIIQAVENDTTVFGIPAQRRTHIKPGR